LSVRHYPTGFNSVLAPIDIQVEHFSLDLLEPGKPIEPFLTGCCDGRSDDETGADDFFPERSPGSDRHTARSPRASSGPRSRRNSLSTV
jgi:hypothetical protein